MGSQPATTATVVDGQGETPVMTDGPYLETKEVIGGFWVIDAPDLDVALKLAAEGSKACRRQGRGPSVRRPRLSRLSRHPMTAPDDADGTAAVERVFREEYGRLIASLVRRFGDIDIAEEAAGEALVAALEKWPESGVPPNPGGWLTTTAGNRAIDRIRREKQRDAKHQAALMHHDDTPHEPTGPVEDDRLRLLFTCCHPALAPEARIALTLRLLGGLTVAEIAQAFLVPETTMAQRITRAKKKIAAAKVPYRVPEAADLPERLGGVLAVLFLVFNEGYLATGDGDPVRAELTGEAIRLTRILRGLLPEEPEVAGLLALLLLTEARREARVRHGQLVPLGRAGPRRLGPRADRRGPRPGPRVPRDQPARPLPDPRRDQRRAHRRPLGRGHRLVAGGRALRPADPARPVADRRAQPRGRGRGAGRPGGRPRPGRPAAARRATTPGTPPAPTCSAGSAGAPRRRRRTTPRIAATQNSAERAYLSRKRGELV